jgi:hypothetical protein
MESFRWCVETVKLCKGGEPCLVRVVTNGVEVRPNSEQDAIRIAALESVRQRLDRLVRFGLRGRAQLSDLAVLAYETILKR